MHDHYFVWHAKWQGYNLSENWPGINRSIACYLFGFKAGWKGKDTHRWFGNGVTVLIIARVFLARASYRNISWIDYLGTPDISTFGMFWSWI